MKKISTIKYKKERVILSDILPYETPITFSNRFFYDFLIQNGIETKNGFLTWKEADQATDEAIFLIFGITEQLRSKVFKERGRNYLKLSPKNSMTIPFSYGISHKEGSLRMLSVIHPRNQVQAISFYDDYKESIIYYSGLSTFSLRAPAKVARSFYFRRGLSLASVIEGNEHVEQFDKSYKNLRSFFSYKDISNIFQFFESNIYHQCEQKYNKMAALDVSKCFDSIYTHSIAWAVLGKEQVKDSIASSGQKYLNGTFPDKFDSLMQQQNYNETNGILIGPELSRIFAELILQKVDFEVRKNLEKLGFNENVDYKIFRYVDDYFVFFNDDLCYKNIVSTLESNLNEFKLGLNTEKEKIYHKPIITEITIAKRKLSKLISDRTSMDISDDKSTDQSATPAQISGTVNIKSSSLITDFKTIIKESDVKYKDIVNYSLSIVEKKTLKLIKDYRRIDNQENIYRSLLYSINSIIDFCFFIYSVSPKVNSTIKITRVLYSLIVFSRSSYVSFDDMHQVFKRIFDHIYFVINKYETNGFTQVETLYLLTVLSELGKNYWLEQGILASYFGVKRLKDDSFTFGNDLNYFSITVLFFYMKSKTRYDSLRKALTNFSISKLRRTKHSLDKNAEALLLALDLIACPYIDQTDKNELLDLFGVDPSKHAGLIQLRKNWFTKWEGFDFGKELDAKVSVEVY